MASENCFLSYVKLWSENVMWQVLALTYAQTGRWLWLWRTAGCHLRKHWQDGGGKPASEEHQDLLRITECCKRECALPSEEFICLAQVRGSD